MNEQQYLNQLEQQLGKLPSKERADIKRDFEEYFEHGRQEGKSTEEIIEALGKPEEIAIELLEAYSEEDFVEAASIQNKTMAMEYHHIKAKIGNVNVTILPTDRQEAYVEIKDKDNRTEATLKVENDTLIIDINRKSVIKKFFFITIVGDINRSEAKLFIPAQQYESIKVKNNDGSTFITDFKANEIKIKSLNGRIVGENLIGKSYIAKSMNGRVITTACQFDELECSSSNGRVIADGCVGGNLKFASSNGRVQLENVEGSIIAKSSNGRVEATLQKVTSDSRFETSNGSVFVSSVAPLENVKIEGKTTWGNVKMYDENTSTYHHGTQQATLSLYTSNGKIIVQTLDEEI